MAKGNHSFTEQDIRKRFSAIVGHTVAEVDSAGVLAASKASRNKGRIDTARYSMAEIASKLLSN